MSLLVRTLSLRDFRNVRSRDLELGGGMNVFVGPNATGKTNAVEALQLLTAATSFRHPSPSELVREGCERGRASCVVEGDGRRLDVACEVDRERRSFVLNGKRARSVTVVGTLPSVLFEPDHLLLVKGAASRRRQEVDQFAAQVNRGYRRVLSSYAKGVEQRNRLLRDGAPDPALLGAWDESVSLGAAALLDARMRLLSRLLPLVADAYRAISDGEDLSFSYECSLGVDPAGLDRAALADAMRETLGRGRADELRRGMTLVGPHRDDLRFAIDGREARTYGSQGQQRSVVLALKMAEVSVAGEVCGTPPLLLLDDVMSELDARRRSAVARMASDGVQTVMTTTNLEYFSPEALEDAQVVRFGA